MAHPISIFASIQPGKSSSASRPILPSKALTNAPPVNFYPLVSQRMLALMPRLKNIRMRRTWRGLYPMTPDGFPIVGWCQDVEGLFFATGMSGQGFMLGPGLAELITRTILESPSHQDEEILSYFSPYRSFNTQEKLQ